MAIYTVTAPVFEGSKIVKYKVLTLEAASPEGLKDALRVQMPCAAYITYFDNASTVAVDGYGIIEFTGTNDPGVLRHTKPSV